MKDEETPHPNSSPLVSRGKHNLDFTLISPLLPRAHLGKGVGHPLDVWGEALGQFSGAKG